MQPVLTSLSWKESAHCSMQASATKAVPHHAACLLEAAESSPQYGQFWLGTARDRSACILTSAKGANLLDISSRKERPELAD